MENKKYILYGASFNPPHIGHFSAIKQMLEKYDKVIIFPYPKKYSNYGVSKIEDLPPISQRLKMLEIFCAEFFPQINKKLILTNLASEMKKNKIIKQNELPHTYHYLEYVQNKLKNKNVELHVCLGFDDKYEERKEIFYKEKEIKEKYGFFQLEEEVKIKTKELRNFLSNHKNLKSVKDELYIKYIMGNELAKYVFKNNLYGIEKKKILTLK